MAKQTLQLASDPLSDGLLARSQYACLSFFSMWSELLKSTINVTDFQNLPAVSIVNTVSLDMCSYNSAAQ
jgi:hypothetical protein